MLNVYRSVGREQVEQYLYKLLDPMLKEFADRECRDITVQDDDKLVVWIFTNMRWWAWCWNGSAGI